MLDNYEEGDFVARENIVVRSISFCFKLLTAFLALQATIVGAIPLRGHVNLSNRDDFAYSDKIVNGAPEVRLGNLCARATLEGPVPCNVTPTKQQLIKKGPFGDTEEVKAISMSFDLKSDEVNIGVHTRKIEVITIANKQYSKSPRGEGFSGKYPKKMFSIVESEVLPQNQQPVFSSKLPRLEL